MCWNDKLWSAVLQKRKVFEQWLQQTSKEERRRVKATVTVAEDRFGTNLSQNFDGQRSWSYSIKFNFGLHNFKGLNSDLSLITFTCSIKI